MKKKKRRFGKNEKNKDNFGLYKMQIIIVLCACATCGRTQTIMEILILNLLGTSMQDYLDDGYIFNPNMTRKGLAEKKDRAHWRKLNRI